MVIASRGNLRVALICVFLILLALLSFMGLTDKVFDVTRVNTLQLEAQRYLEDSFDRSFSTFLTLSVLKVGLDILEGSTVNVAIASIEVGDLAQSAYDQVDFAWRTTLIGGIAIIFLQTLIRIAIAFDSILLGIGLLILAFWLVAKYIVRACEKVTLYFKKAAGGVILSAFAMYILLPVSILLSSLLTASLTDEYRTDAEQNFLIANSQVEEMTESAVTSMPGKALDLIKNIVEKLTNMARSVFFFIAALVLDCIIFPIGLLWLSWKFTKFIFARYFDVRMNPKYEDRIVDRLKDYLKEPLNRNADSKKD